MHKIFCTSTVVLHLFPSPQKPPKLPSIPMGFLHIPTNFNQTHPHPVQDFQKDSKEIFGYCQSNAPSNAIRTSNMKYKLINGSSNIIILFYFRCADVHTSEIHTHPFDSSLSRSTRVSQYQKGKTDLDFTEASAGPYASLHLAPVRQPCQYPTTQFLQARRPSCCPANSVKALNA